MSEWAVRDRKLSLDRPLVMGILNITPDSFSDGGRFFSSDADIFGHAVGMLEAGADIVDVGGESTRPGATPVTPADERRRVVPVIQRLAREHPQAVLSVDTVKSSVARAAVDAGAHIINDVSALRLDRAIAHVCVATGAGLVVMHSRGGIADMGTYNHANYRDVVGESLAELRAQVETAREAGIPKESIVVDPGIGFAKKKEHSLAMLSAIPRLAEWGYPVLVGVSRKRFIGEITGATEPAGRLSGTLGAIVAALAKGARVFRVHDVRPAREALDVAWEILRDREQAVEKR